MEGREVLEDGIVNDFKIDFPDFTEIIKPKEDDTTD